MDKVGEATQSKKILLFSDGTGNSSGKLFKTNVWRLYEALDLGPGTDPSQSVQVAYYDNGVGTSGFKPWAVLGGIFGLGLKRNVLTIYRYACRNYAREGDAIQAFGFSRGAFTIRLVVALIASQGLVDYDDERDLQRKSAAAYRAFRSDSWPRFIDFFRKRKDDRKAAPPVGTHFPRIEFVGVWDTVAAYGGPIAEITRAIDNWFFRLSMPDYQLNEKVQKARHALALDDERDSFHPLLWDEVHEQQLIDAGTVDKSRLQQVWFTGMHADVGGGYPDESLSYVSLCWIMEGALEAGMRLLPDKERDMLAMANPYGPLHDSRRGLSSYYRYQPRRISAWLEPVDDTTRILRDPSIVYERGSLPPDQAHKEGQQRGLLTQCRIHESVIARIVSGTDDYAPITLPQDFEVVPPINPATNAPPVASAAVRKCLDDTRDERGQVQATSYDHVWKRRVLYFTSVFLTAWLAVMPFWAGPQWLLAIAEIGQGWMPFLWFGALVSWAGNFLPGMAAWWVASWSKHSLVTFALLVALAALWKRSGAVELTLRDEARHMWWRATGVDPTAHKGKLGSALRNVRESLTYQRGLQSLKWHILPNILGPAMWIIALWALMTVAAQVRTSVADSDPRRCSEVMPRALQENPPGEREAELAQFHTSDFCYPTHEAVIEGRRYAITLTVTKPWKDGRIAASPLGMNMPLLPDLLASPWQRVAAAQWFQPVAAVRPDRARDEIGVSRYFNPLQSRPLVFAKTGNDNEYRAEFEAPSSGRLFLFVNDAIPPLIGHTNYFYSGSPSGRNEGRAEVVVTPIDGGDTAED